MLIQNFKSGISLHQLKQSIKWTVYILLLLNFYFYILEDSHRAIHSLDPAAPLLKWMQEFATSIDFLAWLVLIMIFELDTYILEDHHFTPLFNRLSQAVRALCYLFVVHTIFAYGLAVYEHYFETVDAPEISTLCQLGDTDISFVSNLRYTYITAENCSELGSGREYFFLDDGMVVTDRTNLQLEKRLAWFDFIEACCWFLIMVMIELNIRVQNRGITGGPVISLGNKLKLVSYIIIMSLGIYWAFIGHLLYFWDEVLWIGGFAAIEMNVADWRDEIREKTGNI